MYWLQWALMMLCGVGGALAGDRVMVWLKKKFT